MESLRRSSRLAGEESSPAQSLLSAAGDGSPASSSDEDAGSPLSSNMNVNTPFTSPQGLTRPNAISVSDLALVMSLDKMLKIMAIPISIDEVCRFTNVNNINNSTYRTLAQAIINWNAPEVEPPIVDRRQDLVPEAEHHDPPVTLQPEAEHDEHPVTIQTEPPIVVKTEPTSDLGKATNFLANRPEAQEMAEKLAEKNRLDRPGGNRLSNQFDNVSQYQDHATSKNHAPSTVISSIDPPILRFLDWSNAEEYEKYLLSSNFSELVMEITFALLGSEKPGEFIIRTFDPGKLAMRQINAHKHSAIGTSPYEVIFGTRLTMDMKMYQETPVFTDYSKFKDPGAFLNEVNNKLLIVYKHALANLEESIMKKAERDPETETQNSPGQYILYRNLRISQSAQKKLAALYLGPYKIIKKLTGDFYLVQDHVQDKTLFCHAKDMRLFKGVSSDQEALDLARSDSDEHFVKKVVGHSGDPTKLKSFRFNILFDDEQISYLPEKNQDLKILLGQFKDPNILHSKRARSAPKALSDHDTDLV